jgi:protein tyrosine phosphatase type 4A
LVFADGTAPPDSIVEKFIKLLDSIEKNRGKGKPCVAVHCVAGLGRAPVLVAIAMVEAGLDPLEVIKEIRSKRPGALNVVQLKFLQSYKRRGKSCVVQ